MTFRFIGLLHNQIVPHEEYGCYLQEEYKRNTEAELVVLRLMMPCFHAKPRANTAAEDGEPKKRGFFHTPLGFLRLPFINAIQKERHDIDDRKIDKGYINQLSEHQRLVGLVS